MSNDDSNFDEDMALFARRFNRFMRRGQFYNKQNNRPDSKEWIICYPCNKPSHMKINCPILKKKSNESDKQQKLLKKKAFHVTWDDSDSSSDEEERKVGQSEMANMCFMAYDDFVSDSPEFTFE